MPTASYSKSWWSTALATGLLAGVLDISAALISYSLRTHKDPVHVFYFIAAALFGPAAYKGGAAMVLVGALMHFLIAWTFALFFFLVYPHLRLLRSNVLLSALLCGVFVWSVMNLVMLPLLHVPAPKTTKDILISMAILVVAIGLPLSYFAHRYYERRGAPQR